MISVRGWGRHLNKEINCISISNTTFTTLLRGAMGSRKSAGAGRGEGRGWHSEVTQLEARYQRDEWAGNADGAACRFSLKGDCIVYRIECLTGSLALNYREWGFI